MNYHYSPAINNTDALRRALVPSSKAQGTCCVRTTFDPQSCQHGFHPGKKWSLRLKNSGLLILLHGFTYQKISSQEWLIFRGVPDVGSGMSPSLMAFQKSDGQYLEDHPS